MEPATPFSGVLVVGDANDRLYEHVSGFANYEHRVPITVETRFRIASLSKQFAGLLSVMLADEGSLGPGDPVHRYIPALAGTPAGEATLGRLLAHRSGLSSDSRYMWDHVIREYPWNWRTNRATSTFSPDTFRARMAEERQATPPDSAFLYCNECYVLAGHVMAEAAGAPDYETLLTERILEPLEMRNTGMDRLDLLLECRAYAYEYENGVPRPITRWRNLAPIGPAGAMYSTVGDLEIWVRGLLHSDEFLSPEVKNRFHPTEIGYQWGIGRERLRVDDDHSVEVVHHTGQIAGTFAWIAYLPERDIHVILLSNFGFTLPQTRLMSAIAGALAGVGESSGREAARSTTSGKGYGRRLLDRLQGDP